MDSPAKPPPRTLLPLFFLITVLCAVTVYGQEETSTGQSSNAGADLGASNVDASRNIMLARSSTDYRVTPGDVYTLAYTANGTSVAYTIVVDASYRIRVSNLGVVNGTGKTFMQLKTEVETIISDNYPLSGVQLVLAQYGIFSVYVKGEVAATREVHAWGLTRLSSLFGSNRNARSSERDILLQASNGTTRGVYDLFKARRNGDLTQDPYLRPGDVVTFRRASREVSITGAVDKPGRYQLLRGENLKALIDSYAGGYTPVADRTRVHLVRYVDSKEVSGDIIYLSEAEAGGNYELRDYDTITVPAITAARPSVPVNRVERRITIEGAVRRPGTYNLLTHENLKTLIDVYADGFTPWADRTTLQLLRYGDSSESAGAVIIYLSGEEVAGDYELRDYDVITIFTR